MLRAASPRSLPRSLRAGLVWLAVTGLAGLAFWASAGPAGQDGAAPDDEKTGGDTTVFATGQNAFSFPLANLPD